MSVDCLIVADINWWWGVFALYAVRVVFLPGRRNKFRPVKRQPFVYSATSCFTFSGSVALHSPLCVHLSYSLFYASRKILEKCVIAVLCLCVRAGVYVCVCLKRIGLTTIQCMAMKFSGCALAVNKKRRGSLPSPKLKFDGKEGCEIFSSPRPRHSKFYWTILP